MKKDKKTAEKNPDITERKRTEETLRHLATVVRDSNDAIIIQDIDGRITAWNRGAELIYGYSEAEALGMSIERLSPPDKVTEQKEFTRRLIAGEAVTSFETRRVTKDGRILDVWLTVTKLVEDPADSIISTGRDISRPIGVALIERNITQRKRVEEELQRSEQSFKSISENAHDGIIVALKNGACIYANRRASEITGYAINEILKTGIEGLAHPDESLKLSERRKKILARENVPNQYDTVIIHKGGNAVPIEITSARTFWYGQAADIFVFRDTTERKRAEDALRASEENYRTLFETMSQGVVYQTADHKIASANPAAERILGLALDQMQGQPSVDQRWKVIHEDGSDFPRKSYPSAVALKSGREVLNAVIGVLNPKDNSYRWINVNAIPQFKPGGNKPYQVYTTFEDITERKKAEEALRESEGRYKALFSEALDGICLADAETGEIIDCNQALAVMVGRDKAELIGQHQAILHSSTRDKVSLSPTFRQHLADKAGQVLETQVVTKTGEIREVEIKANMLNLRGVKMLQGIFRDITERKQAEEALKKSEENFHRSLSDSPLGIRIIKADGKILYANQAILDIYGYDSVEELRTTPRKKIYTPESYAEHLVRKEQRQRGEYVTSNYEIDIIRKDGEIRHLDVFRKEVLWNGETQFQVIYNDITERKRTQEALRESEERFRALTESSLDVTTILDAQGVVLYQSPNYASVWGRVPSGEAGKDMFKDVHPDDMPLVSDAFVRLLKNPKEPLQLEVRALHTDGTWRTLDIFAHNHIENPAVRGIVVNFRDITERKRTESALRKSEEYFKEVTENSSDIVIITDKNGDIKYCSHSIERFTGYKPEELIGKSAFNFIHPDDVQRAVSVFGKAILTKDAVSNTFRIVHKDGSVRFFDGLGRNLLDNPSVAGFIMNIRDVTERKQAEEDLRNEHMMLERTEGIAKIGSWEWDVATDTVTWSDELFQIFQRDPREGAPSFAEHPAFYHPDDMALLQQAVAAAVAEGTPYELELRAIRKDGETRVCVARGVAEMAPGGRAVHLFGSLQDITERKRAEEALEKGAQLLRDTGEIAKVGGWEIDVETRDQVWTEEVYLIHEVDMTYKPTVSKGIDFYSPTARPIIERAVQRAIEHGEPFDVELEFITAKGNLRWVHAVGKADQEHGKVLGTFQDITERKKAEEALQETNEKLHVIFDSMGEALTVVDLGGNIVDANKEALRLHGFGSKDEIIGRKASEMVAPVDRERAVNDAIKALKSPYPSGRTEYKLVDTSGREFDGEFNVAVIKDNKGKSAGFIGIARDISERKRAEEALWETEERYESLFNRSLEAIYISDLNGNFTDANPYALKLLGYEKEEIASLNFLSLVDKEYTEAVYKVSEEILRTGSQKESTEYKVRKKDGTYAWIETDASLLYKHGKPAGIQGIARDITERKRAEEALRESESKYRLLAENASDVISVTNMNMQPIYMSPSIARLLGYSVEEAMARGIEGSLTPESIKVATAGFAKAMTEKQNGKKLEPVMTDLEFIRKDGSTVWVSASVAIIHGSDGQPVEILSILHNISERKRAEEELVKYKDHLEELVKERTEELDKAKVIAEQATKAKSEFLANMSHEIRTPLSTIIGFSELLFDDVKSPLNDEQKKYLGYVTSSGQHLLSLINDILDLSKVEAGKMELLTTSFSLSDLLKNSFSFIGEKAMKHNIKLLSEISADVDMIEADERKVKQIIYNLLSNAVKFTPDGGSITVGADVISPNSTALPAKIRKGLPDTKYVLVSLKDTGIGIAKKDQSKLFTEFQQIEEPYSKKYEGTGLGLALSKRLVTLHGGKIWFESKGKGKGCTFHFILPVKILPNP